MKRFELKALNLLIAIEVGRRGSHKSLNQFSDEYASWGQAKRAATGYDFLPIFQKGLEATRLVRDGLAIYERDTVIFDQREIFYPLLSWLLFAASLNNGSLRVLDFGGALGTSYFQNKPFFSGLREVFWGVVEQYQYIDIGRAEFATSELKFYESSKECVEEITPNLLLLSSVLQYLEEPYKELDKLLKLDIPFVIIDRMMAHHFEGDRIVVQTVPPSIYEASYPVWLLSIYNIEKCIKSNDYEIVSVFEPHPGTFFGPKYLESPYIGWCLKKATQITTSTPISNAVSHKS
jgi:putative methyltransferase (TIGR04325 family)